MIPLPPSPTPNNLQVILFDLGNTLIYFDTDWGPVMQSGTNGLVSTLIKSGLTLDVAKFSADFHCRMIEYYRSRDVEYVEQTTAAVLQTLLEDHGYPLQPRHIMRSALDAFYAASQPHWQLESDAAAILENLLSHGYRLGIITNASDIKDVNVLIDQSGLRPYFEQILISAEVGLRKPHSHIFQLALDFFSIQPHQAAMVGDTLIADIKGANQIGMHSVWITKHVDQAHHQIGHSEVIPSAQINTLSQLPAVLTQWDDSY